MKKILIGLILIITTIGIVGCSSDDFPPAAPSGDASSAIEASPTEYSLGQHNKVLVSSSSDDSYDATFESENILAVLNKIMVCNDAGGDCESSGTSTPVSGLIDPIGQDHSDTNYAYYKASSTKKVAVKIPQGDGHVKYGLIYYEWENGKWVGPYKITEHVWYNANPVAGDIGCHDDQVVSYDGNSWSDSVSCVGSTFWRCVDYELSWATCGMGCNTAGTGCGTTTTTTTSTTTTTIFEPDPNLLGHMRCTGNVLEVYSTEGWTTAQDCSTIPDPQTDYECVQKTGPYDSTCEPIDPIGTRRCESGVLQKKVATDTWEDFTNGECVGETSYYSCNTANQVISETCVFCDQATGECVPPVN
jgi:hypothetical protein